jgi:hypothetical protein
MLSKFRKETVIHDLAMLQGTPQMVLDNVSKSHLDNAGRFRSTIAANKPATIIVVSQINQRIRLLHHESLFPSGLGLDPETVFVTGNRVSAPLKLRNVHEAVALIGSTGMLASTRTKPIESPNDDDKFNVTSKAEFTVLKAVNKNHPLKDRPNHLLVKLRILELTNCCQSIEASELAWRIVQSIQMLPEDTDEDKALVSKLRDENKVLMAYL